MENSKGNIGIVVVAVIVGLIVGFGGAKLIGNNNTSSNNSTTSQASTPSSATKAGDLRSNLVALGAQHMDLTDHAVDAALDGSRNADAVKADLIKNGQEISGAVGNVYGQGAQKQFQDEWNLHLADFVKYAVADKMGDDAGKTAALNDTDQNYTKPISQLLSGANPNLPEATVETAFRDHVTMTAQMIDDHVQGKYTDEATMREQGVEHLKGLMSTLAGAIVKQYPAKFQG